MLNLFISNLAALPCLGLLLLLLIPKGELLRKHIMYLIGKYGNKGKSAQNLGTNHKVAEDLIRWGILETNGELNITGIALVIMLIEAKSPSEVASSLGANAGAYYFYHDIIANAAIGESDDKEDITRFSALLKQFLEQEQDHRTSSVSQTVDRSNAEASLSGPLAKLAYSVHALAGRPGANFERNSSYLKLRNKVSLFPRPNPQQARIIWKIEGRDGNLSIITSFNAIFGIYLGSRTCRVSLFSADTRKQELIDYAKRLEESLTDEPNPGKSVRDILFPTLTGRRTLTVSWTIPIDHKTTPEDILTFASEVWNDLSRAMEQIDAPSSVLTKNSNQNNNNTDQMNYLVMEVKNNRIERRYGYHLGNTPGEAIAAATVNLSIPPELKSRMNCAWLFKSIFLIPQGVYTSIKTSSDGRYNEGAISCGAGLYYVNCRKFVGITGIETALYQRMRVHGEVTWHDTPRAVMGEGSGTGYVGYANFNNLADAHAYLTEMAFNINNLSQLPANSNH